MPAWAEFEQLAPEIAEAARRLWAANPIGYLATVRRDGAPRLHPIVPLIGHGEIGVAVAPWSPKHRDLLEDGRFVLHTPPAEHDEEVMLRGRVRLRTEAERRAQIRETASHGIRDDDYLFDFDIEMGLWSVWTGQDTGAIAVQRKRWPQG